MKHLQIAIQIDADRNGANEVNVTPIDVPLADAVANPLALALGLADLGDSTPGNGQLDEKAHVRVPVRINLFVTKLNVAVDVDATAVVRVVDKA